MSSLPLLAFAVTLVIAVLLRACEPDAALDDRVVLAAGLILGSGVTGVILLNARDPVLRRFAELALVAVLFSDGMRITLDALRANWSLAGRALMIGLPLTLGMTAWLAHAIAGVAWIDAWLVGAALAPTDPVFAAALVGHKGVPDRVQYLLNVESGLNDGLALPIVMTLLAIGGGHGESSRTALLEAGVGSLWDQRSHGQSCGWNRGVSLAPPRATSRGPALRSDSSSSPSRPCFGRMNSSRCSWQA
jgi:NhaP-type Na+/H+ or K+/H+ antiporter